MLKDIVQKLVAPITGAVKAAVRRSRDPWYSDDERKREINARAGGRWIPRRPDWLRRG